MAPAGCSPRCRGRAAALTAHSPNRHLHAAPPVYRNPRRRAPAAAPTARNPRGRLRALAPADCSLHRRLHAVVPSDRNRRLHVHAAAPAGCNPRRPAHAANPADCNRCRPHAAPLAARSRSRPVRAEAHPYGCSRSSPALPGPHPPQAAVVAHWSGDPRGRPHRPPKHAAALLDAHSPSCPPGGPCPSPGPGGNPSGDPPNPRHPESSAAGTAVPRSRHGPRPPHAHARTPTPLLRDRKPAGGDKTALRSSDYLNHAEAGKAAHRPPHALPGRLHRPGSARCQNRHAAHPHARHPHARHQPVQHRRHAVPPKQPDPALSLDPGRQSSGRNHVPPNPLHADRTPLPPRLPPPLPSGPFYVPRTVSSGGLPGRTQQ